MQATRQLFGTDGIRAVAGEYPLNPATVFAIGRALGARLKRRDPNARVVFGQDTRESSAWISETLARGLKESGVAFASAGVLTTPGVAYLTRSHGFAAGIVVSASHNPWRDNGIKLFGPDGMKLADAIEHEIENEIFSHLAELAGSHGEPTKDSRDVLPGETKLRDDYVRWLSTSIDTAALRGMRVLVDCANGAATSVAPELFGLCGVDGEYLNVHPNGQNINDRCGALHPEHVAKQVAGASGHYSLGITFDGDADRALFSDGNGRVVNGDAVMLLAARDMKKQGRLKGDTVVATTMSNMGLEKALRGEGIRMLRANVGDKYVLEQMLKTGATLGGEQSGHILFMDGDSTTGDGLLTALRVIDVVARSGKSLQELVSDLKDFPQVIRNVKVREKLPMDQLPMVMEAIRAAEAELNGNGRVVVRYSGTEKLARVMIEAESEVLTEKHVEAIAGALQKEIGA
ncbi:MAG TPA: phosphoglucosamine mutase [Terriglobales bacterium]|nr:phosphoglucosamine mutase [Terriglobales bacterium]